MHDERSAAHLLAMITLSGVGPAAALKVTRGQTPPPRELTSQQVAAATQRIVAWQAAGIQVAGFYDEAFPPRLRDIPSPPAVVWMVGSPQAARQPRALAVVGTRRPSRLGQTAADTLTRAAARHGAAIISGLAAGVDSIGHRAALAEGVPTVAVLGCGVDQPRDRQLARAIVDAGGLLLGELPPGTPASARTLVARNRLQSALAQAVLVAQTAVTGGTPHTARFAAQQDRPVFCPSPPGSHPSSAGLHLLLSTPARDLPDVMAAFASARKLCERIGERPLARPVTRDNVDELLAALAG